MTGTTISQLIALALIPVLARMFSPEEMGQLTYFTSIIMFVSVVSMGRYEQAIVLPKTDKEAINILALSSIILIGVVIIISLCTLFFIDAFRSLHSTRYIGYWIWLVPITVLFKGIQGMFALWNNRKKRFGHTSSSNVGLTIVRSIVQVIGGFYRNPAQVVELGKWGFFTSLFSKSSKFKAAGISQTGMSFLFTSITLGYFTAALLVLFPFLKNEKHLLKEVNKAEIKKQAKIYKKFPTINTLHALTDEIKNFGVNQTIIFAFSDIVLGFYGMTFRVLRAPMQFIGGAFSQVFYQKASEMRNNKVSYVAFTKKTLRKLFFIALPIFAIILIFGPELFSFVLGDKWKLAGVYAQYLTPWLFLNFVVSPVQNIAVIVNKQGKVFGIALVGNIIIFGSIFLGGFVFDDILKGFILLSVLQILYFTWIYFWILKIAKEDCLNFEK